MGGGALRWVDRPASDDELQAHHKGEGCKIQSDQCEKH